MGQPLWDDIKILGYIIQRSAKVFVRRCEKFVTALAYLFCLALLGSCLTRFTYFFADLCNSTRVFTMFHAEMKISPSPTQSQRKSPLMTSVEKCV